MIREAIFFIFLCATANAFAAAVLESGKIINTTGQVSAKDVNQVSRNLKRGDAFFDKDVIMTAASSSVSMKFRDGTLVELEPNSNFEVTHYAYNQNDQKGDSFYASLLKGGFRTISGSIGQRSPENYEIKARTTTLTIRGTGYYVRLPMCKSGPEKCDDITVYVEKGVVSAFVQNNGYDIGQGQKTNTLLVDQGKLILCEKTDLSKEENDICDAARKQVLDAYSGGLDTLESTGQEVIVDSGSSILLQGDGGYAPPQGGGGGSPCEGVSAIQTGIP